MRPSGPREPRYAGLVGTVEAPGPDGFTLRAADRTLRVEMANLPEPREIEPGERVRVWGRLRLDGPNPTLSAQGLTRLRAVRR